MASSGLAPARGIAPAMLRMLRYPLLAALAAFVIVTCVKALLSPLHVDDFPESLANKVELLPLAFPLHMVTGGLALLLVPAAFLLRHRPRWHRPMGRVAAIDVIVAGITAYPVALVAPVTQGSALGFAAQASAWLALLIAGSWCICTGRTQAHRACMLMMLSVTSGAIFFRIYLALWAIFAHGRQFELFYACDAWIAWGLPLAITATLLWREHGAKQAVSTFAGAR
jgi:hypothetical protein